MQKEHIRVLDCTLRDGGYLNDWRFGCDNIINTAKMLTDANIDIVEIGFMREQPTDINRAVWNSFADAQRVIPADRKKTEYAVMCEVFNPFPQEKIPPRTENSVDIIRVIVWRQLQDEALKYCEELVKKGYKVSIQPDRVNQYSLAEFQELVKKFAAIHPWAIYIVDSNGFLNQRELLKYLQAADACMPEEICLGYHGHNNLLQAIGTAERFCELELNRDIILDASVTGIGRSSGNLNLELIAEFLNANYGKNYEIQKMAWVYDTVLKPIEKTNRWGYSFGTFLTSAAKTNPNYAAYLEEQFHMSNADIAGVLEYLSEKDRVIFNKAAVEEYVKKYLKNNGRNKE